MAPYILISASEASEDLSVPMPASKPFEMGTNLKQKKKGFALIEF